MEEKKITQQLNDRELEETAGGYLFDASVLYKYDVLPWQVLDKNGKVVGRFRTREEAMKTDQKYALTVDFTPADLASGNLSGLRTRELTWEQVQKLRETGKPD